VLNPKGDNIDMMIDTMRATRPARETVGLLKYNVREWSLRTWSVANYGNSQIRQFIPWPDTQRGWAKHLMPDQVQWLDQFLPPKEAKN
jgi:hypothetical protein